MNRRGFLAALAGLPFVGWLFKPKPTLSFNGVPIRMVDTLEPEQETLGCPYCGGQTERMTGWCQKCDRVPEEECQHEWGIPIVYTNRQDDGSELGTFRQCRRCTSRIYKRFEWED